MERIYTDTAKILKALSDPKRLRIVDMLSCGELCACQILEAFHVTQPTLSHDMKLLVQTGIVKDRREGKNIYYSLDKEVLGKLQNRLSPCFSLSRNVYATTVQMVNAIADVHIMIWRQLSFSTIHRKISIIQSKGDNNYEKNEYLRTCTLLWDWSLRG